MLCFQIRDIEIELDEEKRRHAETVKILRKKERTLKEIVIQSEEDHKNVQLLQDTLEKATQKLNLYKRQLQEQVTWFGASDNFLQINEILISVRVGAKGA